eukprot:382008_1
MNDKKENADNNNTTSIVLNVIKEGSLWSHMTFGYQKKYVKLTNDSILICKNKKTRNKTLHSFDLNVYNKIKILNTDTFEFAIQSTSTKDSQKFKAKSQKQMNAWMDLIKKTQEQKSPGLKKGKKRKKKKKKLVDNIFLKTTINNDNEIKDEVKNYDETSKFELSWNHISSAIRHELCENRAFVITEIINKETKNNKFNIVHLNDLSKQTVQRVFDIIRTKKKFITKKEVNYMEKLVERARKFDPCNFKITNKPSRVEIIGCRTFKCGTKSNDSKYGLLYFLGTDGLSKAYENPMNSDKVQIYSSKLYKTSASKRTFINVLNYGMVKTQKMKEAFIAVKLNNVRIKLSHFTLQQHVFDLNLTDIELQGSNDGNSWIMLKKFNIDDMKTNKITNCKIQHNDKNNNYFSFFRFFMHAKMNTKQYLTCGGMELYGDAIAFDQDTFDVYRTYRFIQYQFEEVELGKDLLSQQLKRFNFNPYYIIDDNITHVFQLVFAVSLYLTHHYHYDNAEYEMKMYIICKRIECIYDEKLEYSYNIDNIEDYLTKRMIPFVKKIVNINNIDSVFKIKSVIESMVDKQQQMKDNNIILIIDRRKTQNNNDSVFYLVQYNNMNAEHLSTLDGLDYNYFLGMIFKGTKDGINTNRAYLKYGMNDVLRFYPEYLTSIAPRLFKKPNKTKLVEYKYLQSLYATSYKHGFGVKLDDPQFMHNFKILTNIEHVSVNYNRQYIKPLDVCNAKHLLELENCCYIEYIIESLQLFKRFSYDINDKNTIKFKLEYLQTCYDHLITTHRFCINRENRKQIQKYIAGIIGDCNFDNKCNVLNQHASRQRENESKTSIESHDTNYDNNHARTEILRSILNSMHSYLVHTDNELFRLRQNDRDAALRFTTQMDDDIKNDADDQVDIKDKFGVDSIHIFLADQNLSHDKLNQLNAWFIANEYDSDSLLFDIKNGQNQSNFFSCLVNCDITKYFEIIKKKFKLISVKKIFHAINFGVSILEWLNCNEFPKFPNLKEEILNNKYSTIDDELYQH